MDFEYELSDEQIEQFARELYYSSDLIAEVSNYIANNREEYERFLEEKRCEQ